MAGDCSKAEGRGVRGWAILIGSLPLLRCGNGVDGNKLFLPLIPVRAVLTAGDANESERAPSGETRAGSIGHRLVGPTLDDEVSVKERYHGLRESKWWDTVKENREEEQEPILPVDFIDDVSNRRDDARG